MNRIKLSSLLLLVIFAVAGNVLAQSEQGAAKPASKTILWINPLDLMAGDPTVRTSFNAITSGVGSGLSGLIVESTTTGDTSGGGNKVVETGVEVPPGYVIKGVRVCYESSNKRSFITQIRLSQVQNPPSSASVQLDDGTDLTNAGPVCVDSQATSVYPAKGAVFLSLRLNFGNTADRIVIRALGLHLANR